MELKCSAADRGDNFSPQALYEDWHLRALGWAPPHPVGFWDREGWLCGVGEHSPAWFCGSLGMGAFWSPHSMYALSPGGPPAHPAAAAGPQMLPRGQAVSSKASPGSSAPAQSSMVPMHPMALPCPRVCGHTPQAQILTQLCHGAHGCGRPGPSAHRCCQGQPNPLLPLQPVVATDGGWGRVLTPQV